MFICVHLWIIFLKFLWQSELFYREYEVRYKLSIYVEAESVRRQFIPLFSVSSLNSISGSFGLSFLFEVISATEPTIIPAPISICDVKDSPAISQPEKDGDDRIDISIG